MKRLSPLLLALVLAACAAPDGTVPGSGGSVDVVPDSDSRARARIFTDLAAGYFARGQYKIVLAELRKALAVDPSFGPTYNLYGLVYMELGEDALAEENFRRALQLDPADSEARNNFGWFLCTRGQHDAGLAEFAAAIRNPLYERPELAIANAGQCAALKGDYALAARNYEKALKLTPDNPGVLLRFAELHYREHRLDDARSLLERYRERAGLTPDGLWLASRIERRSGHAARADALARQLAAEYPDAPATRRMREGAEE